MHICVCSCVCEMQCVHFSPEINYMSHSMLWRERGSTNMWFLLTHVVF